MLRNSLYGTNYVSIRSSPLPDKSPELLLFPVVVIGGLWAVLKFRNNFRACLLSIKPSNECSHFDVSNLYS
jgi:hypothetical protein